MHLEKIINDLTLTMQRKKIKTNERNTFGYFFVYYQADTFFSQKNRTVKVIKIRFYATIGSRISLTVCWHRILH